MLIFKKNLKFGFNFPPQSLFMRSRFKAEEHIANIKDALRAWMAQIMIRIFRQSLLRLFLHGFKNAQFGL